MRGQGFVIIGCGRLKGADPAPAADLYAGAHFRCEVRWARSVVDPDHLLILSAEHGLILGTQVIAPYDATLAAGRVTNAELAEQITGFGVQGFTITLAGKAYRDRLVAASRGVLKPYNPFFAVLTAAGHNHSRGYQAQALNAWHGRVPGYVKSGS